MLSSGAPSNNIIRPKTPTAPAVFQNAAHDAAATGDLAQLSALLGGESAAPGVRVRRACWAGAALRSAAANGHVGCARVLLDHGAMADHADRLGSTALHRACRAGHVACARLLLDRGASPDLVDKHGDTALAIAAPTRDVACTKLLLERAADPNRPGRDGATALYWTCWAALRWDHKLECVELLLQFGADPNTVRPLGINVDHFSRMSQLYRRPARAVCCALLGAHADRVLVCCVASDGVTVLGAQLQATLGGNTALLFAAQHGQLGCVALLLVRHFRARFSPF